jgi:dienelactone hydrolase
MVPFSMRWRHVLILVAVLFCFHPARGDDALAAEANRRNDDLVKEGFNLTQRMTVTASPRSFELLVPPSEGDETDTVVLWFAAPEGELSVRMTGPGGEAIAGWKGRSGEQRFVRALAPGKYVVEAGGAGGHGLVGVKGPVVARCKVDPSRFSEHAPAPGFSWPYLLLAPRSADATTLLVLPNNTGFLSEDPELLRASATCELAREVAMADRLGVAVLVPMFPRTAEVYTHALSRDALTTKTPSIARVDLQLIAMIDHARSILGKKIRPRVLMTGFSASGSFAARFTMLHPERVLAAAIGSPGGWPLAPSGAWTYPVGISDVSALTGAKVDIPALRKVSLFLFIGDQDENDSVPFRDSFTADDEALVMKQFGKTPVARWDAARGLYEAAKLRATFKIYPGVAHQISPDMARDVEAAFVAAMR